MEKINLFFQSDKGRRLLYELKSFAMTFVAILAGLSGITEATDIKYIVDNQELIIGSLSVAFSRSLIIYILSKVGLNYRQYTKEYK